MGLLYKAFNNLCSEGLEWGREKGINKDKEYSAIIKEQKKIHMKEYGSILDESPLGLLSRGKTDWY